MLLDAATNTELAAYDLPGYNDRWDLAEGGTQRVAELIGECQNLIAATASLVSAEIVLALVHPLLLPSPWQPRSRRPSPRSARPGSPTRRSSPPPARGGS
ncbi:hypothetical protein ACFQZC_08265 [Streptacidiphilus monticola]